MADSLDSLVEYPDRQVGHPKVGGFGAQLAPGRCKGDADENPGRTERLLLRFRDDDRVAGLRRTRLERAIGVIYRPEAERASHYFRASLPALFDAVFHFDRTRAVEPLERTSDWDAGEVPETFPTGI
jgi:Erythromycin esterase